MPNTKVEPHKIEAKRWLHMEPIKLKDKNNRNTVFFDVEKIWGFRPSWLAITKVRDHHDMIMLSAEMTPEEFDKRQKLAESLNKTKVVKTSLDK
jgi:hypothetical protein